MTTRLRSPLVFIGIGLVLGWVLRSFYPSPGVVSVRFLPNEQYYEVLKKYLEQAEREIAISMFLFAIRDTPHNRPAVLGQRLIQAARRGVRVSLLLEREEERGEDPFLNASNRFTAIRLRERGVPVAFDSPRRRTHTKLVVIDRRYVFIGSHNWTQSALKYNNEASLLVDSPQLAQAVLTYFSAISHAAKE